MFDSKLLDEELNEIEAGDPSFRIMTISDIKGYEPPESLFLVGDGHIVRGKDRIHLIAGYPGVGKSRSTTYLAYCGATKDDWFGLPIKTNFKTLFIQSENGPARLKRELEGYDGVLEGSLFYFEAGSEFHMADPISQKQIRSVIEANDIGMVVIDPLTNLATDVGHREYKEAIDQIMACLPDEPELCPAVVVVSHCRKANQNAVKPQGSELMHEVIGSQVLVSRARTAFILERVAPKDSSDNRVIVTCAKANDAEELPRVCYRRENVVWHPEEDFDWDLYDSGKSVGAPKKYSLDQVVKVIEIGEKLASGEWRERAKAKLGISEGRFYDFRKEAVKEGIVVVVDRKYSRAE